jgi:hypothetical protein
VAITEAVLIHRAHVSRVRRIAGRISAYNRDNVALGRSGQAGLFNKFVAKARADFPEATENLIDRKARLLYQNHMERLSDAAAAARRKSA